LGDIKVGATGLPANSGALKRVELNGCTTAPNDCPRLEVVSGLNRPTSVAIAPDGSIYVIDGHDQKPCHQADPSSWDVTHGGIYKIRPTGSNLAAPGDLS